MLSPCDVESQCLCWPNVFANGKTTFAYRVSHSAGHLPQTASSCDRYLGNGLKRLKTGLSPGLNHHRRFQLALRETRRFLKASVDPLGFLAVAIEPRDRPMLMFTAFIPANVAGVGLGHEKLKLAEGNGDGIPLCEGT